MNDFDELVKELIYELLQLNLDELTELRNKWNLEMERKGMPDKVVAFCNKLIDLVVEKKLKKVGVVV